MLMLSVVMLYVNIMEVSTINSFNVSNVLQWYKAVCGNAVCDKSLITDGRTVENLLTPDSLCPVCTCEKTCLVFGNCCPDVFFSMKPSCMKMDILYENQFKQEAKSVLTIVNCPPGSDKETKRLCEMEYDAVERIKNVPISSIKSGLTYRNIHCSKCSNESADNLISWNMETDCAEFADFNFISSFDEIMSVAKDKKCNMFFTDKAIFTPQRPCNVNENVVNSCNVTGTWTIYNSDVDYACKTYDNQFHFFKNVFCYICNPPQIVEDIIGHCNVTGLWFPFDIELENACLHTLQTSVTGKFKNIYCFLCNNYNSYMLSRFHDINVSISERAEITTDSWLKLTAKFIFEYDILNVDVDSVLESGNSYLRLHNVQTDESPSVSVNYIQENENRSSIDILAVLQKYYASTGMSDFCHNYSFFETTDPCYCDDSCYFSSYGCCIDKYFQKSTMCTDDKYSTSRQRFLVYNSCTNFQQNPVLNKLCKVDDDRNLFLFLPTLYVTQNGVNEHYKNIYCALCNENTNSKNLFPWKLKLECDVYIPSHFHHSFEEYISFAIDNSCHIYYEYNNYRSDVMTCERQTYSHCNSTGLWKQYDTDILEACENYNIPRDAVCSLCNPENSTEIIYSACNVTGMWDYYDPYLDKNCLKYPAIQTFAPYKNYFCKKCNKFTFTERTTSIFPSVTNLPFPTLSSYPSYRFIFAFSNYKEPTQETTTAQCNESQILNTITNDCRDIVCYPGRVLQEARCLPLIETTRNLGYILSVSIEGEIHYSVHTPLEFLKAVRSSFESFINDLLQVLFESSYFVPNITCSETTKWINGTKVSISIYTKFFIVQPVNRTFVEQKLVLLPGTTINVSYTNLTYRFDIVKDEKAIFLPNYVSKIGFTEYCFLTLTISSSKAEQYVHSHVNNLLLCQQIELTKNELELDTKTLKLRIKFTATDLSHDQYLLSSSGGARICIETFRQLSRYTPSQQTSLTEWDVIQIICTCVSLICLLSTFVTYCLFPSLRTLPGKNNMCLVFAMFCSHFLFQFVLLGQNSDIGCQILGVLLHYFWLVTFACLNVCSFHMFRVFRSITVVKFSEKSELIKYIFYSFSTPAFIVLLNISVTAGVSGGSTVGYGGHVCFLSNKTAFIVTFVVPVVLICFLNIFFFAVTAATIARRPKLNPTEIQSNQIHFVVYIKLFSITGVSWIFQIIDSFLPASSFSYIISILNTLQGVFIFISYVCNKRVYTLYKNCFKSIDKSSKTSPKSTVSTGLNESTM